MQYNYYTAPSILHCNYLHYNPITPLNWSPLLCAPTTPSTAPTTLLLSTPLNYTHYTLPPPLQFIALPLLYCMSELNRRTLHVTALTCMCDALQHSSPALTACHCSLQYCAVPYNALYFTALHSTALYCRMQCSTRHFTSKSVYCTTLRLIKCTSL